MDYSLKEFAGRIKYLREAKGNTLEELAKHCSILLNDYAGNFSIKHIR